MYYFIQTSILKLLMLLCIASCTVPKVHSERVPTNHRIAVDNDPKGLIIVSEDFDSGGWSGDFEPDKCNFPYSCQIVDDPDGGGGKVFRAEYRVENCIRDPYMRETMGAELRGPNINYDEMWIGLRIYFDSETFGPDSYQIALFNTHAVPDKDLGEDYRSSPFSVHYRSGLIRVNLFGSKEQVTPEDESGDPIYTNAIKDYIAQPTYDAWNYFIVHIIWDKTGDNGLAEVWHNGTLYRWEKINLGFNDRYSPYIKFGLYNWQCASDHSTPRISYIDDVTVSVGTDAGFCDVAPPGSILPAEIQCQ